MAANRRLVSGTATTNGTLPKRRWHLLGLSLLVLLMALPGLSSLPVIDRDEARFAQSSVQMVESGDYVEIRLGERARNKKPIGAYWAQAAMLKMTDFGAPGERPGERLWAQRLPSVLGGLLTVLLTYLAATPIVGRKGAALAGAMLATSLLFTFEAHMAKTDALLLASTTAVFAALGRLRAGRMRGAAWLFWIGLGAAVLIKGPVGPAIALLALGGLWAWERRLSWAKPLMAPLPIVIFFAIWLPWVIAIGLATDGAFFAESLGRDFGGKLATAQEDHGGPPGYHLIAVWIGLWPSALFLLPGAVFAWQAARRGGDSLPARGMRLAIAWVVPFWIVLELVPTKLPHYALPLYPALCIAMAGAVVAIWGAKQYAATRWASALMFLVVSAALLGLILSVQAQFGDPNYWRVAIAAAVFAALAALVALICTILAKMRSAVIAAGLSAIPLSVLTYGLLLPGASPLSLSQRIVAASPAPILSLFYGEDSLRYYAGTGNTQFGETIPWHKFETWEGGTLVLDERLVPGSVAVALASAEEAGVCLFERSRIKGFNYTRADEVDLVLLGQKPCPASGRPISDSPLNETPLSETGLSERREPAPELPPR